MHYRLHGFSHPRDPSVRPYILFYIDVRTARAIFRNWGGRADVGIHMHAFSRPNGNTKKKRRFLGRSGPSRVAVVRLATTVYFKR
jgi:hypothetical protein